MEVRGSHRCEGCKGESGFGKIGERPVCPQFLPQFFQFLPKAIVERCVSLILGHPFEFSWLEVSQADVFHQFLLVSCDSWFAVTQSRSSSFCYQIVVREAENRQLLHFF